MGVLGDVGIHILDFVTHIARSEIADLSCRLKTFDKAPGRRIGAYGLDVNDSAALHVSLESGGIGVIHATRFASGHINDLRLQIFGTEGGLDVEFRNRRSRLRACLGADLQTATWRAIDCPAAPSVFARFIAAIRDGGSTAPDFARGAALQKLLDLAVASDAQGGRVLAV